jgi:urease accessory protein
MALPVEPRTEPLNADAAQLLDARLAVWFSPAFPVGAFAYSHGQELAAERGWVRDRAELEAWIAGLLTHGGPANDLILLKESAAAVTAKRPTALTEINELACAFQPSAERRLETVQQGNAFLQLMTAAWPFPGLDAIAAHLAPDVAYPVSVGIGVAGHGIAVDQALHAYAMAFVTNITSAAIRLSLIGQTDGQRVIAALMPNVPRAAMHATASTLDDLGGAAFRADIASLAHETQYTRLFRS